MINFDKYVKLIHPEYFDSMFQFGYVLLYTFLYDKALNQNHGVNENGFSLRFFIDSIKNEFDFLNNMNFSKNYHINSLQNTLPKNLWLLAFNQLYMECRKFNKNNSPIFSLRNLTIFDNNETFCENNFLTELNRLTQCEIHKMSTLLSKELIKISNCFLLNSKTKLYRVILLKKCETHKFETKLSRFVSCSISFGTCFFSFGINKFLESFDGIENEYHFIIYEIYSEKLIQVIPTSICCLQEEEEIVLIPGTILKTRYVNEIKKEDIIFMLQTDDLPEISREYLNKFFVDYSEYLKFFLYSLEI